MGEVVTREGECEKHGAFEETGHFIREWGKTYWAGCRECAAEEEEKERERQRFEEQQREHSRLESENVRMNIEPEFYAATFDTFEAATEELKHHKEKVQELVTGAIKKIVMTGKNGTGKTHLACAALHAIRGRIMSMYEISATIRASYAQHAQDSEIEIVDKLARVPLLVIDELGRTKGSDTEANWLSYIIDKRHTRGLPLILISNKHVRKSCEKGGCPDCLENYIGEDIMSRLVNNGVLLRFQGEDWRKRSPTRTVD